MRKIKNSIDIATLDDYTKNCQPPIQWHSLTCTLATPMYGGGVRSTVVDEKMPIRVTGIRGQLRFWWRLLAKQKWYKDLTDKQISQKEFALWGGMADNKDKENDGKASLVMFRVRKVRIKNKIESHLQSYKNFIPTAKDKKTDLSYVLFPASNETDKILKPHRLLVPNFQNNKSDLSWQLDFAFAMQITEIQKNEVIETLQWWASFGGLGFRTRKGLGAVRVIESADFPQIAQIVTADEVKQAGCQLVQRDSTNDPMRALSIAINKLKNFRQGVNLGRNEGQQNNRPGRSRWPEPDALRTIHNTNAPLHTPEHPAGNVFPRAMFGLPIVFHFVGRGEPSDTNLVPNKGERLSSPLILRPVYDAENNQWKPSALLLPYQHIIDMQVSIANNDYPIWTDETANNIRPIQDNLPNNSPNVKVNPLTAFLTYFSK